MPHIAQSALVPYSDQMMFDLVKDIDRYVEFLPWCADSEVLSSEGDYICGRLLVARMGVKRAFTTRNRLVAPQRIELTLQEGPFQSLQGAWEFLALRGDACKVSLTLDFVFSNSLMEAAFGKVFQQIANTMVDSFCQRAKQVYGTS